MFGPHGGVLGAWDCGRGKVKRWPWVALGIPNSCPRYSKKYPSYLCLRKLPFWSCSIVLFKSINGLVIYVIMIIERPILKSVSQSKKEQGNTLLYDFWAISFLQQLLCHWHLITCVWFFPSEGSRVVAGNSESWPHYIKLHPTQPGLHFFGHFFCWYIYPA